MMILSLLMFLMIYIIISIFITIQYSKGTIHDNEIWLYHDDDSIQSAMIGCWVFGILSVIIFFADANLVFLHLYLMKKGITTFQYIILMQERKEYAKDLVNILKNRIKFRRLLKRN